MSFLAILLLSQTSTPKAILDRYAQFREKTPAFEADWDVTAGGRTLAHGTIMVDGAKRMLFRAQNGTESYSLSETELGVTEMAPNDEVYEQYPPIPRLGIPPSKLGPGASFVPAPLTRTAVFAPKMKYAVEPQMTLNGQAVDIVGWTIVIQMIPTHYTIGVDSQGRIVRMSRASGGGGGPMAGPGGPAGGPVARAGRIVPSAGSPSAGAPNAGLVWTISNYRPISHPTLTAFSTPLPKGYVPYSTPAISLTSLAVDDKFPALPWKTGSSTTVLNTKGKPAVILITAPDCAPSQRALADLHEIKADVPGVSFATVSLARSAAEAHGLPFDSTGKAAAAIGETSTPLFVLVDGTGKIANLWAGFDPDGVPELTKQISTAVKALTKVNPLIVGPRPTARGPVGGG